VLARATDGQRDPSSGAATAGAVDAAGAAYEARIRPTNARLPDWNTLSAQHRDAASRRDLARLDRRLGT
jgi:hypothetical protein